MLFRSPVNFNSPYKATNIIDFWKRWHITLNRFFTKYVYIPLGGNRKGEARMYLNLLLVFLLSGLWHGAGWNFIVWGALHGVLYVATRFRQKRFAHSLLNVAEPVGNGDDRHSGNTAVRHTNVRRIFVTFVSRIALFIYVSVAWVYFRAESIGQANQMLVTALRGPVQKVSVQLAECLRPDEFWYVLKVLHLDRMSFSGYIPMAIVLTVGLYLAMVGPNAAQRMEKMKYRAVSVLVFAVLMVWCVLTFSQVSTFLYFNF